MRLRGGLAARSGCRSNDRIPNRSPASRSLEAIALSRARVTNRGCRPAVFSQKSLLRLPRVFALVGMPWLQVIRSAFVDDFGRYLKELPDGTSVNLCGDVQRVHGGVGKMILSTFHAVA